MLIVVEGCVGSGKTTVARGLAAFRGSGLLLEDFRSNPFLDRFYRNPAEYALEVEFAFLLLHSSQLREEAQAGRPEVVADFHLSKDLIYAKLNLTDQRTRACFDELYDIVSIRVPAPTLMVMLDASTELVLKRITARNRNFERQVSPDYFAQVNAAYQQEFARYQGRKIVVPMDEWDFVADSRLFGQLSTWVDREFDRQ